MAGLMVGEWLAVCLAPQALTYPSHSPVDPAQQQAWFRSMWEGKQEQCQNQAAATQDPYDEGDAADDEDDGIGDDFNEFAEEGGDDDFGDFDEAEDAPSEAQLEPARSQPPAPDLLTGLVSSVYHHIKLGHISDRRRSSCPAASQFRRPVRRRYR